MKVFSVCGLSGSGKTTTIEHLIPALIGGGYSVGSVKDIHSQAFTMDTEGKNTFRHKQSGSSLVTARGLSETDVMYPRQLSLAEILKFYNTDFCVVEGCKDDALPKIITASTVEELDKLLDDRVIAISGVISNTLSSYRGIQVIDATQNVDQLLKIITNKVFDVLPLMEVDCCNKCGLSCCKMCAKILDGSKSRSDCDLDKSSDVSLVIDGESIEMVAFVKKVLTNNILAVAKELKGYKSGAKISIEIGGKR